MNKIFFWFIKFIIFDILERKLKFYGDQATYKLYDISSMITVEFVFSLEIDKNNEF